MMPAIKKAAGGFKTTTATATHNATDFIAAGARHASAGAAFHAFPCHGIGKTGKGAAKGCATVLFGASNTIDNAGNLPDSEVFSRPEFKAGPTFRASYGFGRDGLVREAGRMALSMFETSRPPVARSNAASGYQSHNGAETMTTVNTIITPTTGNTSPLVRQQAIENALSTALWLIRHPNEATLHAATGFATRAASMLKQACAEIIGSGRTA